ncbi:MAG: hypothetical protein O2805_00060 [Proteobacteria bacterium]|nr:hypothetical protein [Pseudomonadota bacterium]
MRAMIFVLLLLTACTERVAQDVTAAFDPLAERYVKLALALGEHDADYVDAYFGPAEWRDAARANPQSLADIASSATELAAAVRAIDVSGEEYLLVLRQDFIASHLESLATVARMRDGTSLSFDDESRLIYGFVAPTFPRGHYDAALQEIEAILPGDGPVHERVDTFRQQFLVPEEKVEAVIRAGIDECRARTLQHLRLPEGESFQLEMVSGNPWSAYNWYQGAAQGLIQVETSRPSYVSSATRLGCHEGYPGHHAFSSLLDQNFLQDRGWVEFSVLPLFSPQGLIFEGSGDFAERIAFPGSSRNDFLRDKILPVAGIDNVDFETNDRLKAATDKIRYADIEAARNYLDGHWDREQTKDWITHYALVAPEQIDAWFRFTERYRAYKINYVLGEDLVEAYVRRANPAADEQGDWEALATLLSYPPTPLLFAPGD